ncbi:MAG: ATP-binding protein [Clostridium septicum]|uniref:ATP-binding protein n=1 Tax=Clostridium septicum TaxID=1504 RepID=UPI002902AD43|nr:ATP-binding protein [Clostridium septicum]MDU1312478.1 ATP-binding protein [Clostridium septicum]
MGKVIKIDFSSGKKNYENKFYMMIGLPCSGKSHYCKEKFYNSNTIVISTDEIRKEITGTYDFDKQSNKLIFDTAKNRINQSLLEGYNVVFDATNTNSTYRKRLLKVARNNNCKLEAVVFMTPIEVCIDRNLKRDI